MEWNEYIDWIKPVADEVCAEYDLPSACVIAQELLEFVPEALVGF